MTDEDKKELRGLWRNVLRIREEVDIASFRCNLKEVIQATPGMTQAKLADEMAVSRSVVSNYVNGNTSPALPLLTRLAIILDVKVEDLTKLNKGIFSIDEDIEINVDEMKDKISQIGNDLDMEDRYAVAEYKNLKETYSKYLTDVEALYNKEETIQKEVIKEDAIATDSKEDDDAKSDNLIAKTVGLNKADDDDDVIVNVKHAMDRSNRYSGYRISSGQKQTIVRLVKAYLDV